MKFYSSLIPNPQSLTPNPLSLYVHIPYCLVKCPYCDFNVYAVKQWPEEQYVEALCAEFRHYVAQPPWQNQPIETLYFGGGTPSLFAPSAIARFLKYVTDYSAIAPQAEITLEADPASVSYEKLAGYRAIGVNRLSFGVQSFHPTVLKTLGRLHTIDDVQHSLAWVREAGFRNVSLDLIFAVPGQTLDMFAFDVSQAIAYGPTHLSTYCLTYEERTPFFSLRKKGRLVPVSEDEEIEMYTQVRAQCKTAGYEHYEISSFAQPQFRSRHNTNYWNGTNYLGLGAGAHSYANTPDWGIRWSNERNPRRYMEKVITCGEARSVEDTLTRDQAMGEFMFLNLRQRDGFLPAAFAARFGTDVYAAFSQIPTLIADGLLIEEVGRVKLSERGLLLADSIFAEFF
ncbi:MAG: radical SAM family heme chaperone HemW [Deltaproteobacteria bacterium]|nr:radical SAM family heme chaperone HemW [Deltaproteobacteria bacterium]